MLADRCVLPRRQGQYSRAVIFLFSKSEGHAADCDSSPVLQLLRAPYGSDKSKVAQPLFTSYLRREEIIIDQASICRSLISTLQSMRFLGEGCL